MASENFGREYGESLLCDQNSHRPSRLPELPVIIGPWSKCGMKVHYKLYEYDLHMHFLPVI